MTEQREGEAGPDSPRERGDGGATAAGAQPPEPGRAECAVVGIGASAGGLDALVALLSRCTPASASFLVVQHLAPDQQSLLAEILGRASRMTVVTARSDERIQPDRVYVLPPGAEMILDDCVLRVLDLPAGQRPQQPIDTLFRSLADDCGPRAIGVILSGLGADGTAGLKAIKAAGGVTFVQDPTTARYDSMPRSALESGAADFCLPPEAISDELVRLAEGPHWRKPPDARPLGPDAMGRIIALIRQASGNDLGCYKPSTVERRVARRMALRRIEHLDEYVELCASSAGELAALYKDLLIGVTSFFRDRAPFEALRGTVLPALAERKQAGATFRVWVPACSTGEEAYSIAICLMELLDGRAGEGKVQIFGTDIDEDAIQRARRGCYPESIAADVSPERLARFFVKSGDEYQVARRVRECIVFSTQNVLQDPPFSRLDLVSCRNLLIYLEPGAQRRMLQLFHYALEPHGFLLLGTSESVGEGSDLFRLVDRTNKIYANKRTGLGAAVRALEGPRGDRAPSPPRGPRAPGKPVLSLQQLADRKVLDAYGPAGVVINESMDVLQFRGRIGAYLDPTPGEASFSLLRLARSDIHVELRRCVQQALRDDAPVNLEARLRGPDGARAVRIEALPLRDPETEERCVLILFHEAAAAPAPRAAEPSAAPPAAPATDARVAELERDLLVTREYLQSTISELQAYNEELQCSNEELQSTNEELQSTNEEVETSKEELQSMNEELTTVNDELRSRLGELNQLNDDLHNLLLGAETAVVMVGEDLRLRRFTHAAERLLELGPGDVGRSLDRLRGFVGSVELEPLCAAVMQEITPAEREILSSDRRHYRLRVLPYRAQDRTIRGVVLVFSDIDLRKRAADLLRDVGEYASEFLAAIQHPLLIIDGALRVLWANAAFLADFQTAREEVEGSPITNLGPGRWVSPALEEQLAATVATGVPFRGWTIQLPILGAGPRRVHVSGSRLPAMAGGAALLLSLEEATEPAR